MLSFYLQKTNWLTFVVLGKKLNGMTSAITTELFSFRV